MTNQLIPVFNGTIAHESILLCNARDLHAFLNVGRDFSNWIRERLSEYGFTLNLDYVIFSPNLAKTPGRKKKEYHLTLDTAKELAIVERNEKGRQIRRYFIECEKQLLQKAIQLPKTTFKERAPLREAIDLLVNKKKIGYQEVCKIVRQRFGVSHIDELNPDQLAEAISYIHGLALANSPSRLTSEELCTLCWVWNAAEYMRANIESVYPALNTLKSSFAASFYSMAFEYQRTLEAGRKVLNRETKNIIPHPFSAEDENWRRVLPRLRENALQA